MADNGPGRERSLGPSASPAPDGAILPPHALCVLRSALAAERPCWAGRETHTRARRTAPARCSFHSPLGRCATAIARGEPGGKAERRGPHGHASAREARKNHATPGDPSPAVQCIISLVHNLLGHEDVNTTFRYYVHTGDYELAGATTSLRGKPKESGAERSRGPDTFKVIPFPGRRVV